VDKEYHGTNGPLGVTMCSDSNPNMYSKLFIKACAQAGIPETNDYNGKRFFGAGHTQVTIKDGVRQSTALTFLDPVRSRKNLTIATGVHVTNVIFKGDKAVGVNYKRGSTNLIDLKNKKTEFVGCKKEVILSAGAVHSPAILQLSGIGPKAELAKHQIPLLADLPVGDNLYDHLFLFLPYATKDQEPLPQHRGFSFQTLGHLLKYVLLNQGLLRTVPIESVAFTNTGFLRPKDTTDLPDLQLHFFHFSLGVLVPELLNLTTNFWKSALEKFPYYGINFLPTLLLPKSVGTVRLRSNNPLDPPIVDPRYLTDKDGYDRKVLVESIKECRRIAKQDVWKHRLGEEVIDPEIPFPPESDEYISEYVSRSAVTVYHPVGTCKMGPSNDPTAVVTPDLKVKGLKGLRVIDCSICPTIPNANTNAIAICIGEKGAGLIKKEYNLK